MGGYHSNTGKKAEFYNPLTKAIILILSFDDLRVLKIVCRNPVLLRTSLWQPVLTPPVALYSVEIDPAIN